MSKFVKEMEKLLALEKENNENPSKTHHYTPLGDVVSVRIDGKTGYTDAWDCPENSGICEYDLEGDPACDSCIYCDEPMERK